IGPPLQAAREAGRRVRRALGAEEIERARAPEVEIFLYRRQVDRAMRADARRIVGAELLHHFERALDHAADAGLTDEHVMRFFRQHEAAGWRQPAVRPFVQPLLLLPAFSAP